MQKINTGIIGGAGYTGGELIRLLLQHPAAQISFVHSRSNAGKKISSVHQDLLDETDLCFVSEMDYLSKTDVLFLCAGHGEAVKFLDNNQVDEHIKIIDLSQDFRLTKNAVYKTRTFVYGLPEINKPEIIKANNIANPGCFATAVQLGLLPLASKGILQEAYTTGITGSTGAGQGLSQTTHFSWRSNNIQAYKSLTHQHLNEIKETLYKTGNSNVEINFIPWRGDFTRGIFVSSTTRYDDSLENAFELYKNFYAAHPFIKVSSEPISLKQVVNTNNCFIQLEKEGNKLVIHSAIDNLLKGASGQAVQNMNLMCGLDEKSGLNLKPAAF